MRVTGPVSIHLIDAKRKLPLNVKTLRYAIAMVKGDKFPPIKIEQAEGGRFRLKDGRHRLVAAKLSGMKDIIAHYAIVEDPYPYKDLKFREGVRALSQADGCPLPLSSTAKE